MTDDYKRLKNHWQDVKTSAIDDILFCDDPIALGTTEDENGKVDADDVRQLMKDALQGVIDHMEKLEKEDE